MFYDKNAHFVFKMWAAYDKNELKNRTFLKLILSVCASEQCICRKQYQRIIFIES